MPVWARRSGTGALGALRGFLLLALLRASRFTVLAPWDPAVTGGSCATAGGTVSHGGTWVGPPGPRRGPWTALIRLAAEAEVAAGGVFYDTLNGVDAIVVETSNELGRHGGDRGPAVPSQVGLELLDGCRAGGLREVCDDLGKAGLLYLGV